MLSVPPLPDSIGDSPPEEDDTNMNMNTMMQITELPTSIEETNFSMSPAQPRTPPRSYTPTSTPSKSTPSARSATKRRELQQQRRNNTPGSGSSTSTCSSSRHTPKALAQRVRDQRLPTTKISSVFDRLYKTPTAASKSWISPTHSRPSSSHRSSQPRKTHMDSARSNLDDKDLQVFSRLHISGTVANTSKQRSPNSTTTSTTPAFRISPSKSYSPKSPASGSASGGGMVHTPTRSKGGALVFSPRMKPKTKLLYSSRYHPGLGMEDVQPIKLGFHFFQSFCEYESGQMDARTLAKEMIQAFFKQDFPSERHWELEDPQVVDRPGEGHVFDVKMGAKYSWERTQRRATAQGVVRCLPEKQQVIIHNYKCDVVGDP